MIELSSSPGTTALEEETPVGPVDADDSSEDSSDGYDSCVEPEHDMRRDSAESNPTPPNPPDSQSSVDDSGQSTVDDNSQSSVGSKQSSCLLYTSPSPRDA